MDYFDHILEILRANGLDAKDLDTVKWYPVHDPARWRQMTAGEREEASLRASQVRAASSQLRRASEATAGFLRGEGLVAGELWDARGADFIYCFASGMVRLDEIGQKPDGEQGDAGGVREPRRPVGPTPETGATVDE